MIHSGYETKSAVMRTTDAHFDLAMLHSGYETKSAVMRTADWDRQTSQTYLEQGKFCNVKQVQKYFFAFFYTLLSRVVK